MAGETVLVTGSNRGIGLEFVRQFLARGAKVIATCRAPEAATDLAALRSTCEGRLSIEKLDVSSTEDIERFAEHISSEAIDVLVLNAGIKGDGSLTTDNMLSVYRTNSIAPMQLCEALHSHVLRSSRKQVVAISSGVGSITENASGGMDAYRMSKAALNMGMACVHVKYSPQGMHVLSMVPGWVRTDMGGPNGRLSPEESVTMMIGNVIDRWGKIPSGGFYDYNGRLFPF